MKRFSSCCIAALLTSLVIVSAESSTSSAAPPPPGYPSSQVMQRTYNPKLRTSIPLRRGFYDATSDKGFGWDKIWNKHKIDNLRAIVALSGSTSMKAEGTSRVFFTWAGKYKCQAITCRLEKQQKVRLVAVLDHTRTYSYKPKGSTSKVTVPIGNGKEMWGVQTAYCEGMTRCPKWVTFSFANPGKPNPYAISPSTPVSSGPRSEVSRQKNTNFKPSPNDASGMGYVYSYEPLPKNLHEEDVRQAERSSSPLSK